MTPRYPVYIPSKGREKRMLTAKALDRAGMPFRVVVEPSQVEAYAAFKDRLLVMPEDGKGLVYARNWIKDHSRAEGAERHWQFDDDIHDVYRLYRGRKIRVHAGVALRAMEDFVDRYENVALASLNSTFFTMTGRGMTYLTRLPPFYLNARCYTCFLIMNSLPNRWRYRYNEDTDMSLQVLSDGWCTVLFNAFLIQTDRTMTDSGGQTSIYVNDGRLKMARSLERVWPGVVTVYRRFQRPQHRVKGFWRWFDTQLKLKPGVDLAKLPRTDEYGMSLTALRETDDPAIKKLIEEAR